MAKMVVNGIEVTTKNQNKVTYISLTDLARFRNPKEPRFVVRNWMRPKDSIAFIGLWEILNNPDFDREEFEIIRDKEAGYGSFTISPEQWIERTNAVGLINARGRYDSGTFAHPDLAFEFASWLSVEYKMYLIKEFQRLKSEEQKQLDWDVKRELTKINYHIQTDAIKTYLVVPELTDEQILYKYTGEADMLNVIMFGKRAAQWKAQNPELKGNQRDHTTVEKLLVLANLETHNAAFIAEGLSQAERMKRLRGIAERELRVMLQTSNKLLSNNPDEPKK